MPGWLNLPVNAKEGSPLWIPVLPPCIGMSRFCFLHRIYRLLDHNRMLLPGLILVAMLGGRAIGPGVPSRASGRRCGKALPARRAGALAFAQYST